MDASNFLAHRAPTELIYAIFQSITSEHIQGAVALSLACSSLRNHWTTHRSALLWNLCVEHVPHAQEALLAARMTRKVADAEIRGRLPPMDISPGDLLSGSASPKLSMTLSEYHQVRDLNLLARNREARLHHWPCRVWSFPNDRPQQARGETVSPEEPCSMPEWSDRVHLALYRMMILAAGLAGAYHEPTLKATDPEAGMSLIFAWMSAVVYPRSDVTCSVYSDDRSLGSRFISKHGRYRTFPEPCSRAEWHGNAFKVMG